MKANKALSRLSRIIRGDFAGDGGEPFTDAALSRLEKFVHFWVLVYGSFVRNRCPVRASALSYATLLAIIPMLAVAMSVSSVFLKSAGEEQIKTFVEGFVQHLVPPGPADTNLTVGEDMVLFIDEETPEASANNVATSIQDTRMQAAQQRAAGYIHQFIQNTYSGTLGVTGMIFLLMTAILMLTRIEETFNDIWGVSHGRNWISRIVLYWATITLVPLLLVAAFGLMSGPHFEKTRSLLAITPFVETLFSQLLPVAVICLTFALFYKLMPNTKVDFSAALVGGTFAGTAWHIYNLLGFLLASRAVNASKIYGGLALIPLLMGGLYVVWLTVLFGAQVAYAFQNRAAYLQDQLTENINQRGREFIALRLMTSISLSFQNAEPPPAITDMAGELAIPSRLIQQVLRPLLGARLITEVHRANGIAYAPARPLADITAHDVLIAMRSLNGHELLPRNEPAHSGLLGEFARIQEAERAAASSVSMMALVHRAQPQLATIAAIAGGKDATLPQAKPCEAAPDKAPENVSSGPNAIAEASFEPAPKPEQPMDQPSQS